MSLAISKCECSGRTVVEWAIPGLILAFFPKCPLCIVAYVAIVTGIGISVSTATYIRLGLLTFCIGVLLILVARFLARKF